MKNKVILSEAMYNLLKEYNESVMKSFIDQYGKENGKKRYYATANAENRNPETFKKK
jgi:hypothetical protein